MWQLVRRLLGRDQELESLLAKAPSSPRQQRKALNYMQQVLDYGKATASQMAYRSVANGSIDELRDTFPFLLSALQWDDKKDALTVLGKRLSYYQEDLMQAHDAFVAAGNEPLQEQVTEWMLARLVRDPDAQIYQYLLRQGDQTAGQARVIAWEKYGVDFLNSVADRDGLKAYGEVAFKEGQYFPALRAFDLARDSASVRKTLQSMVAEASAVDHLRSALQDAWLSERTREAVVESCLNQQQYDLLLELDDMCGLQSYAKVMWSKEKYEHVFELFQRVKPDASLEKTLSEMVRSTPREAYAYLRINPEYRHGNKVWLDVARQGVINRSRRNSARIFFEKNDDQKGLALCNRPVRKRKMASAGSQGIYTREGSEAFQSMYQTPAERYTFLREQGNVAAAGEIRDLVIRADVMNAYIVFEHYKDADGMHQLKGYVGDEGMNLLVERSLAWKKERGLL